MRRVLFVLLAGAAVCMSAQPPLESEFTPSEDFDVYLLPVYAETVRGAHESEFHNDLRGRNDGEDPVLIYGLPPTCPTEPPCPGHREPFELPPHTTFTPQNFQPPLGRPGALVSLPQAPTARSLRTLSAYHPSRP